MLKLNNIYETLLLTEKDNRRVIVNKLGVDQQVADAAHAISDKFSIWITNTAKENLDDGETPLEFLNNEREHLVKLVKLFKTPNKPKMEGKWSLKNLDYDGTPHLLNVMGYITDWAENPNTPSVDLTQYTWADAEQAAIEWHDSLKGGKVDNLDDGSKIIHKFPDGYYWTLTESDYCDKSKQSMGHCASATESDMYLLHLRKNNEEFITADWHPEYKYVIQLKGKNNDKPVAKYHKYILWLLLDSGMVNKLKTNSGYMPETNFQLSDLSLEEIKLVNDKANHLITTHMVDDLVLGADDPASMIEMLGNVGSRYIDGVDSIEGISRALYRSKNPENMFKMLMRTTDYGFEFLDEFGKFEMNNMVNGADNPDGIMAIIMKNERLRSRYEGEPAMAGESIKQRLRSELL